MVRRISALSVRIGSRASGLRSDSRASRSSIDGACAMIRRNASVVTQNPSGTRTPSMRESSPRCAPLPPTSAPCDWLISRKLSTSLPIVHLPSSPLGPRSFRLWVGPPARGSVCGVHCQHTRSACIKAPTLVYLGNGGEGPALRHVAPVDPEPGLRPRAMWCSTSHAELALRFERPLSEVALSL